MIWKRGASGGGGKQLLLLFLLGVATGYGVLWLVEDSGLIR